MGRHVIRDSILRKKANSNQATSGNKPTPDYGGVDSYQRRREPSHRDLLLELKNAAYACAMFNSQGCAKSTPRLYVATFDGQERPKCLTKSLPGAKAQDMAVKRGARQVEEVVDHPLLTLLKQVNPFHGLYDLMELTTLYQEVHGHAFWYIEAGMFDVPAAIWPLCVHLMRPIRKPGSKKPVDYYEYWNDSRPAIYQPEELIHFRYPDPRDPYLGGLSPLRAAFELAAGDSEYLARKSAVYDNLGSPGVIVSPGEVFSEDEKRRYETEWNQKFRRGGNGKLLVTESQTRVDILNPALGDLATLAEHGVTTNDIYNAFGVPISYATQDTNLANLQAAREQHAELAIAPRLKRRDSKLNERLVPYFDPSGRLFFESDDPNPTNREFEMMREEKHLQNGVRTINEVRDSHGWQQVEWGNEAWLPARLWPVSLPRNVQIQLIETDDLDIVNDSVSGDNNKDGDADGETDGGGKKKPNKRQAKPAEASDSEKAIAELVQRNRDVLHELTDVHLAGAIANLNEAADKLNAPRPEPAQAWKKRFVRDKQTGLTAEIEYLPVEENK